MHIHVKKIPSFSRVIVTTIVIISLFLSPFTSHNAAALNQVSYEINEETSTEYSFSGDEIEIDPAGKAQLTDIEANWYNRSWQYRQKLVIDKSKVRGEHTDFPVLVSISDQTNQLFGQAQSDGDDILFTSSDGITKLSHEIEEYTDDGSKKLVAWVEVPTITDVQDTPLYMYYGNDSAASQQSITSTWENSFAAVWHLNEAGANGVSSAFDDSTDRGSNGTATNFNSTSTSTTDTQAKIGKGVLMDGVNDYIVVPFAGNMAPANQVSLSMWVKPTAASYGLPVSMNSFITYGIVYSGTNFQPAIRTAGGFVNPNPSATFTPDSWYHVTETYDGSSLKLYIDGNLVHQQAASGVLSYNGTTTYFGSYLGSCCFYNGYLDEVRLTYNVTRSPSYIATEYNNQSSPETFFKSSTIDPTANKSERLSTISPKEDNAVAYTTLSSFTESATKNGGQIRYQLSNDAGKTWYWWNGGSSAWVQETGRGFQETNTADTVNEHISKLPVRDNLGYGNLLWRAYLKSDGSQLVQLDSVTIGYTPHGSVGTTSKKTTGTSLSSPLVKAINSIFKMANDRDPTYDEWKYWTQRIARRDKKTLPELYGAMQWQKLFGEW